MHGSSIGNRAVAEAPFVATHGDRTATVTRWMEDIEAPPFWAGADAATRAATRARSTAGRSSASKAPCTVAIDVGVAQAGSGAPQGDRSRRRQRLRAQHHHARRRRRSCHYFWAFARNYSLHEQRLTHELREGVAAHLPRGRAVLEAQQRAMRRASRATASTT